MRQEDEGSDNLADMLANLSRTDEPAQTPDAFDALEAEASAEPEDAEQAFDPDTDSSHDADPQASADPEQVLEPVFEEGAAAAEEEALEPIDIGNVDDEEYEHPLAQYSQTQRNLTATLARHPVRRASMLRKIGIPTLIGLGLALLVPGMWAVGIFAGWELPLHDKEKVRSLAVIMLVCWPLGLLCFLSAGFMFIGLRHRGKRGGRRGGR